MNTVADPHAHAPRSQRLLSYLSADPQNLQLLLDAASALFDEGDLDQASEMLDQYEAISPPAPATLNLRALIAIGRRRFEEAALLLEQLLEAGCDDPAVRFNLAWCRTMSADYDAALPFLDDATIDAVPAAAALKIQAMHHLGKLEDALAWGAVLAERRPEDRALMSALALVAADCKEVELARDYATRAGDTHEGLSTLGALALDDQDIDGALVLFDRALAVYPDSARALLGKGLGLLAKGDPSAAAQSLDHGAAVFGDHIGSWVASGWAHFVAGDHAAARANFERALSIDDAFAETHGALAVLDIVDGQLESAKRRTETALRLDRNCFSAALAKSKVLSAQGDQASAERVSAFALNTRIGPDRQTLAQAMAGLMSGARRP